MIDGKSFEVAVLQVQRLTLRSIVNDLGNVLNPAELDIKMTSGEAADARKVLDGSLGCSLQNVRAPTVCSSGDEAASTVSHKKAAPCHLLLPAIVCPSLLMHMLQLF